MAAALRRARQIAIVGGGPSGFYTAQYLLKYLGSSVRHLDLFERLPAPYGLVRYGVAPDHPEVKNCIAQFEAVAENPAFSYFGNVPIGANTSDSHNNHEHINLPELQAAYDAVVLSYGTSREKRLGVPGEDLTNVISAREFVGWYNGHPDHRGLGIDLTGKNVAIVGQGNVALDCARMLLAAPEYLRATDITEHSLQQLVHSGVEEVAIFGRRGPIEAAFTIKELRELTKLDGVSCVVDPKHVNFNKEEEAYVSSTRRITRMMKLLQDVAKRSAEATETELSDKRCAIRFFLSPKEFREHPNKPGHIGELVCNVMRLEGDLGHRRPVPTGEERVFPADLVIKSIGYQGQSIDDSLPYDASRNIIKHDGVGRVQGLERVYCSGWIKNGPAGIIATTMVDANNTARAICDDLAATNGSETEQSQAHVQELEQRRAALLRKVEHQAVTFDQWKKLEAWEHEQGKRLGKPAEKSTDEEEMLRICHAG